MFKKCVGICAVILLVCIIFAGCGSSEYEQAMSLELNKDYAAAAAIYAKLGDYKDSKARLENCYKMISGEVYTKAKSLEQDKDFAGAAAIYEQLGDYEDSKARLEKCNAMITVIDEYNAAITAAKTKDEQMQAAIAAAAALLQNGEKTSDPVAVTELQLALTTAQAAVQPIPEMPDSAEKVAEVTAALKALDYSSYIQKLTDASAAFENSASQYSLINAPSEAHVTAALGRVANITGTAAATPDNDPNEMLNKPGGYTAQVYFASDLIDPSDFGGVSPSDAASIIANGTEGGGSVEVYGTVEDANARDADLAQYDDEEFTSGSHKVIGTVVVRTSSLLTAEQQQQLETDIINALQQPDAQ